MTFMPDEVVDNGDGTYTIPDPTSNGDWLIYDTGEGWAATHPDDGWDCLWASQQDAAAAVLGDPSNSLLAGGRTYAEVYG